MDFRVEEPHISIYSTDENELMNIARAYPTKIVSVERPVNDHAAEILNRGEVIVARDNGYGYKVSLREHRITNADGLKQVYEYLLTFDKDVKLTASCAHNLLSDRYWFNTCYFYVKDPSVCTFINLIAPGLIQEISKLTVLKK